MQLNHQLSQAYIQFSFNTTKMKPLRKKFQVKGYKHQISQTNSQHVSENR